MASDEDTVNNIAYLSQYIEESRGRVAILEEELETTRQESTVQLNALNDKVRRSESDKLALQKEVLVLRDTLRVKQEQVADSAHKADSISLRNEIAALQDRLKAESSVDVARLQSEKAVLKEETVRLRENLRLGTERSAQLRRLESENASLRHELVGLQHALKVKQEPPSETRLSEPRLAEVQRQLDEERTQKEALQIKCTSLYAQVKQSADLAAKTLKERVDSLKELAKMRIESGKVTSDLERVQRMCDEVTEANSAGAAEQAALIEASDAAMAALKAENTGLTEQLSASSAKISKVKTKYKKAKADKEALQQMLNELTETPREDEHMDVDSTAMPEDPGDLKYDTSGNKPHEEDPGEQGNDTHKQENDPQGVIHISRCFSPSQRDSLVEEGSDEVVAENLPQIIDREHNLLEKYRQHFGSLPGGCTLPSLSELAVFRNVSSYTAEVSSNSSSFHSKFLYLPGRTVNIREGSYVVMGPTHRYDRAVGLWVEASDPQIFDGSTHELFVKLKKRIRYMGSFQCLDLRHIHPRGIKPSGAVKKHIIEGLALGVPRPQNHETLLRLCYPDGAIKVHAMGLRFVGFNQTLYDSLRKKYIAGAKPGPVISKRKAEEEGVEAPKYSLRKRQKTEASPA
ncbi:hypothetical protein DFH06DRAFT_1166763 [Mycena polygramma]|nr:hypothetical protein DFH06DRAFT_1166763 [Mycena polygramma]